MITELRTTLPSEKEGVVYEGKAEILRSKNRARESVFAKENNSRRGTPLCNLRGKFSTCRKESMKSEQGKEGGLGKIWAWSPPQDIRWKKMRDTS